MQLKHSNYGVKHLSTKSINGGSIASAALQTSMLLLIRAIATYELKLTQSNRYIINHSLTKIFSTH